ncbi:hypothetical protein ACFFMN_16160 [Planobispora siamensis]|uniref:Uncharacterized protein n=1 Tax=Planobispora siamensis TaxID=936338 RepID=A0A8J3WLP8_9ACTN|nr:hypothetical protein [Planobispora siamensis]GIH93845.1 hypothetical protein Psi01_44750 [Planobispora siamensis]
MEPFPSGPGRRGRIPHSPALLAAGALALLMVTLTGAVRQLPAVPATPATVVTPAPPLTERAIRDARPVEEVWPHALVEVPVRAADGLSYRPVAALDAGHILLAAESAEGTQSPGNAESGQGAGDAGRQVRLEVFSTESRQASVLAVHSVDPGLSGFTVTQVEVGENHLVWATTASRGDKSQVRQVWTMPRTGGGPRLLLTFDENHELWKAELAVAGDSVLFTGASGRVHPAAGFRGVLRMSSAGGAPELVAGSEGLDLVSWPWAMPGRDSDNLAEGDFADVTRRPLVNLETGERRVPVPAAGTLETCSPSWCVGLAFIPGDTELGIEGVRRFAQRQDGSGVVNFPAGLDVLWCPAPAGREGPRLDRFVVLEEMRKLLRPDPPGGAAEKSIEEALKEMRDGTFAPPETPTGRVFAPSRLLVVDLEGGTAAAFREPENAGSLRIIDLSREGGLVGWRVESAGVSRVLNLKALR